MASLSQAERAATAGGTNFVHKATGYVIAAGLSREAATEVAKRIAALGQETEVVELASDGDSAAVKLLGEIVDDARRAVAVQAQTSASSLPNEEAQRKAIETAATKGAVVALNGERATVFENADPLAAFKAAARHVHEHLADAPGIVVTAKGERYLIAKESRTAKHMPPLPPRGAGGGGGRTAPRIDQEARFLEAAQAVQEATTEADRKKANANLRRVAQIIDRETNEQPTPSTTPSRASIVGSAARTELDRRLASDPQFAAMRDAFEKATEQAKAGDQRSAEAAVKIGTAIDDRIKQHVNAVARKAPAPVPRKHVEAVRTSHPHVNEFVRVMRQIALDASERARPGQVMVMTRPPLKPLRPTERFKLTAASVISREGDFAVVLR